MRIVKHYILSDSLSSLIDRLEGQQHLSVMEMLEYYIREYERVKRSVDAASCAHNLHQHLDELLLESKRSLEGQRVSCAKGCSSCCSTYVGINRDEAILLAEYCDHENILMDRKKLSRQAAYDHSNWYEQPREDWSCIFLNAFTGSCKVYEFRPANCRKLFSVSRPELCDVSNPSGRVKRFIDVRAEIVSSAMMTAAPSGSLPNLLQKYLSQTHLK